MNKFLLIVSILITIPTLNYCAAESTDDQKPLWNYPIFRKIQSLRNPEQKLSESETIPTQNEATHDDDDWEDISQQVQPQPATPDYLICTIPMIPTSTASTINHSDETKRSMSPHLSFIEQITDIEQITEKPSAQNDVIQPTDSTTTLSTLMPQEERDPAIIFCDFPISSTSPRVLSTGQETINPLLQAPVIKPMLEEPTRKVSPVIPTGRRFHDLEAQKEPGLEIYHNTNKKLPMELDRNIVIKDQTADYWKALPHCCRCLEGLLFTSASQSTEKSKKKMSND